MPFGKGDEFFLFHQRDNRNPEPFGEPFGWDLATTKDFVDYRDCGVAVPRGGDDEQDQFIFADSVFEGEGQYHIFYTGYNRDYPAQGQAGAGAHARGQRRPVPLDQDGRTPSPSRRRRATIPTTGATPGSSATRSTTSTC